MNTIDESVQRMLNRRGSLLHPENKSVPTHNEAMSNLGVFLGETVLHEMSPMAREMMGIDKPFPVAPKTVWLSPGDKMNGKIVLKPPPSEDVIKALTHEGILEIGATVEEKLEKHFQARLKAAKKEVEDFERFECNNRIKFALQQDKLAQEAALQQQRIDLLKMFRKDRDELIEESKTELETLEKKLVGEHEMKREKDVRVSVEQVKLTANQKINELTERIHILENEVRDMEEMIRVEVEKRKNQDWRILHEIFKEMQRHFNTKLTVLHNQHNAELRQLYLEVKTHVVESEQATTINEETWDEDEDESVASDGDEEQKIEFSNEGKPFVINVCKVEGESSEEDKSPKDDHSTSSSFKCHKHRSRPKDNIYGDQGSIGSHMLFNDSQAADDFNTTDASCNILRRLGLNFNVANIEKVKVELDNLLLNITKRSETKLLTATDSLDLFISELVGKRFPGSNELAEEQKSEDPDREEYKRIMNRKKWKKLHETKVAIPLTVDEYMKTLVPIPKYMASASRGSVSIWDYKAMTDEEWNNLLQELDDNLQSESADNSDEVSSKCKTVTVTLPNSMVSVAASGKFVSNNSKKPVRGILRPSVETEDSVECLLKNEVFQSDQMQSLMKRLC